jgi:nucleoid-associated protein YgaU
MAALLGITVAGCGKPVLRIADASIGDYYTDEEYRKLSKEQRLEYCRELSDQRETFQSQIAEAKDALQGLEAEAEARNREVDSLRILAAELEESVKAARAGRGSKPRSGGQEIETAGDNSGEGGGAGAYVVKAGDSLWRISGRSEIYGDGAKWKELYRANRVQVKHPNRIYPGQEIQIPR